MLPEGMEGSISTLPLQWGLPKAEPEQLATVAANLRHVALRLAEVEQQHGRKICLCLEPEPGCLLQRSADVVQFFEEYLLRSSDFRRP